MSTTTQRRPLTGAAKAAHTRAVLLEEARAAIAEREPRVPTIYIAALLVRADALTPVKPTRGNMERPDVRLLPLTGPLSPGGAW